jgi:predicted Zn-dependent protease
LGIEAWKNNRLAEARQQFEELHKLKPEAPDIANNLAMCLAMDQPPELERALDLATAAVRREPDNPTFRDTRGQILAKLGRWQEVATELEYAVLWLEGNRRTHATLADAYEHLGLPNAATEHRKLSRSEPADLPAQTNKPLEAPPSAIIRTNP